MLLAGLHFVNKTVQLTVANSGTVISSAPGQQASVSGGVAFKTSWTSAGKTSTGATLLRTPCPAHLTEALELFQGSSTDGDAGDAGADSRAPPSSSPPAPPPTPAPLQRYVAARHPNGNPEEDQSNYGGKASGWLAPVDFGNATVVVNSSYAGGVYSVGVGGPANNFDPAVSYWAQPHPSGGGASTYSMVSGMKVHNATVQLKQSTAGGYVFMMQPGSWGSWVFRSEHRAPSTEHRAPRPWQPLERDRGHCGCGRVSLPYPL